MSPKLPVISGEQLIRALRKFGYISVRQTGSHVRCDMKLMRRDSLCDSSSCMMKLPREHSAESCAMFKCPLSSSLRPCEPGVSPQDHSWRGGGL